MAKSRMDVTAFVGKILLKEDDAEVLKEGRPGALPGPMEAEVSAQIGALPYERSVERSAYRNGYRTKTWPTGVGTIEPKVPKITAGSYFPSLQEPRRCRTLRPRRARSPLPALGALRWRSRRARPRTPPTRRGRAL